LVDQDNPDSIELVIQAVAFDDIEQRATIEVRASAPQSKVAELHAALGSDDATRKARAYASTQLHILRPAIYGLSQSRPMPSPAKNGKVAFVRTIKVEPSI
jgi:hypothetical protein